MLVGGVVRNEIENQPDSGAMQFADQPIEVRQAAKDRIYIQPDAGRCGISVRSNRFIQALSAGINIAFTIVPMAAEFAQISAPDQEPTLFADIEGFIS
jgi:hypothetical protein